jgi:hypothetical protein
MLTLLLSTWMSVAPAHELAGITLADTTEVGGAKLVLNGAGLREFMWIDIYVGGLYLPTKTTDAKAAIDPDVPKRITMDFIYKRVSADKMVEVFRTGRALQSGIEDLAPQYATLETIMSHDAVAGDKIVIDYVPGIGTTITTNGQKRATLEGVRFMRSLWTIFLGDPPANTTLKKGLLGG